jgi:hypothetical protein
MPIFRRLAPKRPEASCASWPHQWTREQQVDLDGIIYDICVAEHGGRFLAVSVCNECCEQVSINLGSSSAKAAREHAIVGMQLHHDATHHFVRKPR